MSELGPLLRKTDAPRAWRPIMSAPARQGGPGTIGIRKNGTIRVTTTDRPRSELWQATTLGARCFVWRRWPGLQSHSDRGAGGAYVARVQTPASGWTAFFVELTYPTGVSILSSSPPLCGFCQIGIPTLRRS